MDEVLADTLGEIIDAVNFRADLGIKMEALMVKKNLNMLFLNMMD